MNFEGKIVLDDYFKPPKLMVDAQPHVMQRIRKIFDNAHNYFNRGEFTHKPIIFPFSLMACRDLIWIMDRYHLQIEDSLFRQIKDKADEYDSIISGIQDADKNNIFKTSNEAYKLALPLREHQVKFLNMFNKVNRMLLADKMGLGKTPSGISTLLEPESRPAIIVTPPHLCTQWELEIKRFLPQASTHIIRGFKNYTLPEVDILITSYNRLAPWQDVICDETKRFSTVIFDEIQELRHLSTGKREISRILSLRANKCLGLSGTPIYNYGSEIWSIIDVIRPDYLSDYAEFMSEWCDYGGNVYEPATLNNFLKVQGLMLRRTPEECGLKFGDVSKHIYTIDADLEKLQEIQDVAKMLALSVLSGNIGEDSESAREFDWKLRHATGVAKARPVAEFVKMLVNEGDKVLLAGWHRDAYDILMKELAIYNPVMYTGSESIKEKDEAKKAFIEGDSKIFIMSLRSGSGLDGLQRACNTCVFGELDWSPHVMDQVVARLDRDGQTKHVTAYYMTIADGSDPFMISILSDKRSQHDGVVEGKVSEAELLQGAGAGNNRIKEMAAAYLKSIGEEIPEPVIETGLLGEVAPLIRKLKLPTNTEEEMQEALFSALKENLNSSITVEREYKITKRSRLDFLISRDNEKIAIECKISSTNRPEVYRQVRRYVEEGQISSLILVAPWFGIQSFKVDSTPVIVIDTSINSI